MHHTASFGPAFQIAHDMRSIRALTSSDWELFRAWSKYACEQHGRGPDMMDRIDAMPASTWQAELSKEDWTFFAAFEDGKIISLGREGAAPSYRDTREVVLEVAEGYKGQGIGTQMYKAMRDHIANHYAQNDMIARIQPINGASRRSAEKAGMSYSGYTEPSVHGQPGYMVYKMNASELAAVLHISDAAPSPAPQ